MTECSYCSNGTQSWTRVETSSHSQTVGNVVCKVAKQVEIGRKLERRVDFFSLDRSDLFDFFPRSFGSGYDIGRVGRFDTARFGRTVHLGVCVGVRMRMGMRMGMRVTFSAGLSRQHPHGLVQNEECRESSKDSSASRQSKSTAETESVPTR